MASTGVPPSESAFAWQTAGLRYFPLRLFLAERFGGRVRKASLDAGFGCPNRDGALGTTGCVFCNPPAFSPSRRRTLESITQQIDRYVDRPTAKPGRRRWANRLIAYFQPGTNTYAPVQRLRQVFEAALAHPSVVGLAVGTRPDCLPEDVLDLLTELARRTWLMVELGLQSIHDRSLAWMGRGHGHDAFLDAIQRSRGRGFAIGAHVILGLPGESRQDMRATADELARLGINSVKLHQLHAVRGAPLAGLVERGEVRLPELDEYVAGVVDFLERLPPGCVIDRLVGDAPPEYLVGPDWCRDKPRVLAAIDAEFRRRGTRQGTVISPVTKTRRPGRSSTKNSHPRVSPLTREA